MATGAQNSWSTTPASNATADTGINWREGQAPSSVNDSVRAMMAIIKKWIKDWQGGLVTAGTSTAYTLATNEGLTLADGVRVVCRMSATNGAAPTLNVDSTGAVAIQSVQGTAIPTGVLLAGSIQAFTYYAAVAAWIAQGTVDPTVSVSAATTTLAGKAELATDAEAIAKADTGRVLTPSNLAALGGSDTFVGLLELATTGEADTGTDTARAITAAGLKSHVDARIASQANQETGTSNVLFVTPGRQQFHQSAAKVWGVADFAGGVAAYNVTSVTDSGTGLITVNLTTAFSTTNVSIVATVVYDGAGFRGCAVASIGTTSFIIRTFSIGSSPALADAAQATFAGFGDQ